MFRTEAVILSIQRIRDHQTRIIIFSKEYWKISCWYKKNLTADIGNIVLIIVERKWRENHIESIELKSSITGQLQNYWEVHHFLEVLHSLYQFLPEGEEQKDLYSDISNSILNFSYHGIKENPLKEINWVCKRQLFLLIHIRILKQLGFLNQWLFGGSEILNYIYHYIEKKTLKEIFEGKVLEADLLERLTSIIQETLYRFEYST